MVRERLETKKQIRELKWLQQARIGAELDYGVARRIRGVACEDDHPAPGRHLTQLPQSKQGLRI